MTSRKQAEIPFSLEELKQMAQNPAAFLLVIAERGWMKYYYKGSSNWDSDEKLMFVRKFVRDWNAHQAAEKSMVSPTGQRKLF